MVKFFSGLDAAFKAYTLITARFLERCDGRSDIGKGSGLLCRRTNSGNSFSFGEKHDESIRRDD